MLLSNMRSSGRKRKPKIIFQPGPTKEDLAFAEKRRLGAHQMWERRRVNELLAKTLPTPNEPSITTIIIPKTGTKKQKMNMAVKKVMNTVYSNQMPRETKAGLLLSSLEDGTMYGESGKQAVKDMVTAIGRSLYSPYRVAWAMAENASLSSKNTEAIRKCEMPGHYERVMMPSASAIHRENYDLEKWAEGFFSLPIQYIPATCDKGKQAEGYGFELEALVRYILKKFGLYELAQTGAVEIKVTYDGAQLTGNKGHIALGFQIVDPCATDPKLPGKFLYLDEEGRPISFQSRNNVIIARIHMMKENEENVDEAFGEVYQFVKDTGLHGLPARNGEPALHPFRWVGCHDKSATQKVQKEGGGCYNKVLFCNMCECTKHELYVCHECDLACEGCKTRGKTKCMHWSVNDVEEIEKKEVHLAFLLEESEMSKRRSIMDDSDNEDGNQPDLPPMPDLQDLLHSEVKDQEEELERKSKIKIGTSVAAAEIDPMHVDFKPIDIEAQNQFKTMLLQELELRDMLTEDDETVEVMRSRLKERLTIGIKVRQLRRALKRHLERNELMEVEKLVICVMHAENRITEKVLSSLLSTGFKAPFRQPSEYAKYRKEVEDTVNRNIFNHVGSTTDGQWEFPKPDKKQSSSKSKKLMGDVKLTNEKARSFLCNVECLLPICLKGRDSVTVAKWEKAIQLCRESMEWIRKRENFTDTEILSFQDTADEFIKLWIDLNGTQAMTNYLHDLAAGHFSYYLRKYRNLYRYSQQGMYHTLTSIRKPVFDNEIRSNSNYIFLIFIVGWEAFMGLLKTVYHSKTNFGGHSNGGTQSHLKPVVRYLFRELLFRTGDGAHFFEDIKYPGKFDPYYVPPISTDRSDRPSDEEIQQVMDDWSMDEWRVTYTEYNDDDFLEEEVF